MIVVSKKPKSTKEKPMKVSVAKEKVKLGPGPRPYVNPSVHVLQRSEQVTEISLGATVNTFRYDATLNPADSSMFPWLSNLASSFDLFQIDSLVLRYVPRCALTSAGTITMAFDYDVTDPDESLTPSTLSTFYGAVQGPVYSPLMLKYNPNATVLANHKYFIGPSFTDRLNTPAKLILLANDVTGAPVAGSLWVDYTIRLINPQLFGTFSSAPQLTMSRTVTTGPTTKTDPFGTTATSTVTGTIAGQAGDAVVNATKVVVNNLTGQFVQKVGRNMLVGDYGATELSGVAWHEPESGVLRPMAPGDTCVIIRAYPNAHIRVDALFPAILTVKAGQIVNRLSLYMYADIGVKVDNEDANYAGVYEMPWYAVDYNGRVLPPWDATASPVDVDFPIEVRYAQTYRLGSSGVGGFCPKILLGDGQGTLQTGTVSDWITYTICSDRHGTND